MKTAITLLVASTVVWGTPAVMEMLGYLHSGYGIYYGISGTVEFFGGMLLSLLIPSVFLWRRRNRQAIWVSAISIALGLPLALFDIGMIEAGK